jgi:hypothetical protein
MIETTHVIIWWSGAVLVLGLLTACTIFLAMALNYAWQYVFKHLMNIVRATTAIYWVQRMEEEGLTACSKAYREFVKEHKPKTVYEYKDVERKFLEQERTTESI